MSNYEQAGKALSGKKTEPLRTNSGTKTAELTSVTHNVRNDSGTKTLDLNALHRKDSATTTPRSRFGAELQLNAHESQYVANWLNHNPMSKLKLVRIATLYLTGFYDRREVES